MVYYFCSLLFHIHHFTFLCLVQVVLLLLESGAELNPQDCQGNTPLHFASQNGHMESTTLLLIVCSLLLFYVYLSPPYCMYVHSLLYIPFSLDWGVF